MDRFDSPGRRMHTAVLLVHGSGGPDGGWRSGGMLQALTLAGYSVFVPHYFEAGAWDSSRSGELFPQYLQVLQDALVQIAQQPDLETQKGVGLVGFSLGGYLVIDLAADRQDTSKMEIKAVVELYGGLPDAAKAHLNSLPPVLIMHGANDKTVPVTNADELDKRLTENNVAHEIHIYPGQGHGFSGPALKDSNERTVEFLKQHLK